MIEDVMCPRCQSDHVRRSLKTAYERLFFSTSNYYRCRACSLRFRQKPASKNESVAEIAKPNKKPWHAFIKKL